MTATPNESAGRTVLVVDDSAMDRLLTTSLIQKLSGWSVLTANNGAEALTVMEKQRPDLVLTDLLMPEMDGLELVQAVRTNHPLVPVILMTGHGSEDIAIKALKAGAASYVPKKSLARDLEETLDQVMSASKVDRDQRRLVRFQTNLEAHFVLENDSTLIPPLVGHLEENLARMSLCEPSGLVLLGVALHEALSNAIFHGNLELKSEQRETDEKGYYQAARERRAREPYRDRRVHVEAALTRDEATFVVRDQGPGFDP